MNQEITARIVTQAMNVFWDASDGNVRAMALQRSRLGALTHSELASRLRARLADEPAVNGGRSRRIDPAADRRWRADHARAHAEPAPQNDGSSRFYAGRVPRNELRFAQFLYHNRVIDWKTMIEAITWQYRVRPKVGEIGRAYRFLDFDAITRVLRVSERGELFGSAAMRVGLIDRRQLSVMLGKQYQLNYLIGRFIVEHDILSRPEVEHLLKQNRRHNALHRES